MSKPSVFRVVQQTANRPEYPVPSIQENPQEFPEFHA
jgi:hypothetical protein